MENTQDHNDAARAAAEEGAVGFAAPSSASASTSTSQLGTRATRKPKVYISGSAALVWDVEGNGQNQTYSVRTSPKVSVL